MRPRCIGSAHLAADCTRHAPARQTSRVPQLQPDRDAPRGHELLGLADGVLPVVEDRGGQHGISLAFEDDLHQMLEGARAAAGDDRHVDRFRHRPGELQVVAVLGAVAVHGGEQ